MLLTMLEDDRLGNVLVAPLRGGRLATWDPGSFFGTPVGQRNYG